MKMENSVKITGIIAVAVILIVVIGINSFSQFNPRNTITAQGFSEIDVMPDLVTVYFNVETSGDTATEVKDANAEIVDNLIVELIKIGFSRDEIQTSNFNVYPDYEWNNGRRTEKGYKATHNLKVEMSTDESGKIGDVIDAGVDSGALLSYINFELSTELQNTYKAQALEQASQDARIKAESVAKGLDKSLGSLVSVSTSDFNYYPWRAYSMEDSSVGATVEEAKLAATNIQPSEQTVSASVSVVYKIR